MDLGAGNGETPSAAGGLGGESGGRLDGARDGGDVVEVVGGREAGVFWADDGGGVAVIAVGRDEVGDTIGNNAIAAAGELEGGAGGVVIGAGGIGEGGEAERADDVVDKNGV
ncbi:hypothetical protein FWG86_02050 [Candidatus Saccharibacteria bacterium]|nr:hypothetical protein [Candidatus Saccharibacteria bacterium]